MDIAAVFCFLFFFSLEDLCCSQTFGKANIFFGGKMRLHIRNVSRTIE